MTKVPIVDLNDAIINYKERAEIIPAEDIYRGASLWITNSKNEVLLAQRKFDKKLDPGRWGEAVGGTVEGDDTYLQTIQREAEEELGLTGISIEVGPKHMINGPYRYFTHWFTAVIDEPLDYFTYQESEVEQIKWIEIPTLIEDYKKNPQNYISSMGDILTVFKIK